MRKQKLPKGWTHQKIRGAIERYENQTGVEAVAELEEAFANGRGYRTMNVPIEVEDQVLHLIAVAEKARITVSATPSDRIAEASKPYAK